MALRRSFLPLFLASVLPTTAFLDVLWSVLERNSSPRFLDLLWTSGLAYGSLEGVLVSTMIAWNLSFISVRLPVQRSVGAFVFDVTQFLSKSGYSKSFEGGVYTFRPQGRYLLRGAVTLQVVGDEAMVRGARIAVTQLLKRV